MSMECKICGQKLTKDSIHIHLSEAKKQQQEASQIASKLLEVLNES